MSWGSVLSHTLQEESFLKAWLPWIHHRSGNTNGFQSHSESLTLESQKNWVWRWMQIQGLQHRPTRARLESIAASKQTASFLIFRVLTGKAHLWSLRQYVQADSIATCLLENGFLIKMISPSAGNINGRNLCLPKMISTACQSSWCGARPDGAQCTASSRWRREGQDRAAFCWSMKEKPLCWTEPDPGALPTFLPTLRSEDSLEMPEGSKQSKSLTFKNHLIYCVEFNHKQAWIISRTEVVFTSRRHLNMGMTPEHRFWQIK